MKEYQGQKLSSYTDFKENSIRGPQSINLGTYTLQITGLVGNPKSYSYEEIIKNYQKHSKVVRLDCVEGWSVNILWEGFLVGDLLTEARPSASAKVIIFHAHDGYTTSLPLSYITNNSIIIAYKINGITLPPERGFPFQLVAEGKWGYKWIRWITQIELSDDVKHRGYWESRGYSNNGDSNKGFFES